MEASIQSDTLRTQAAQCPSGASQQSAPAQGKGPAQSPTQLAQAASAVDASTSRTEDQRDPRRRAPHAFVVPWAMY